MPVFLFDERKVKEFGQKIEKKGRRRKDPK